MSTRRAAVLVLAASWLVACGGSSPTSPTRSGSGGTTYALNGTVTNASTGAPIGGASVTIADGPNANRTTATDGAGHYSMAGLTPSGFTVNFAAPYFRSRGVGVNLSGSNATADARLDPLPVFIKSGTGDSVFTIPGHVTRIRVEARYSGSCQNFIVHLSTQISSLVNVIIGTCSVADTRSPFSGTYSIDHGGQIEVVKSTGIHWTFTELR